MSAADDARDGYVTTLGATIVIGLCALCILMQC